ncbi:MAG: 3-deoxy-manno-octulosonate cytidylyltransferase [Reyranellaceae bacterium]
MTNPIVVVPARLGAGRLPGKPLLDVAGEALIVHVWRRAVEAGIGPVLVAAADAGIIAAVEAAGGLAVLTDPDLPTGSDRVAAAVAAIDPAGRHDAVVNLQGDLPTIAPGSIAAVLEPLADPAFDMATLAGPLAEAALDDPHIVKVMVDDHGRALDFRRPRPGRPASRHVGVYAFRRAALQRYAALPRSPREIDESLEQLRAMEHGMRIGVRIVEDEAPAVDTAAGLEAVRRVLVSRRTSGSS